MLELIIEGRVSSLNVHHWSVTIKLLNWGGSCSKVYYRLGNYIYIVIKIMRLLLLTLVLMRRMRKALLMLVIEVLGCCGSLMPKKVLLSYTARHAGHRWRLMSRMLLFHDILRLWIHKSNWGSHYIGITVAFCYLFSNWIDDRAFVVNHLGNVGLDQLSLDDVVDLRFGSQVQVMLRCCPIVFLRFPYPEYDFNLIRGRINGVCSLSNCPLHQKRDLNQLLPLICIFTQDSSLDCRSLRLKSFHSRRWSHYCRLVLKYSHRTLCSLSLQIQSI
jgi:hypothetical protein